MLIKQVRKASTPARLHFEVCEAKLTHLGEPVNHLDAANRAAVLVHDISLPSKVDSLMPNFMFLGQLFHQRYSICLCQMQMGFCFKMPLNICSGIILTPLLLLYFTL